MSVIVKLKTEKEITMPTVKYAGDIGLDIYTVETCDLTEKYRNNPMEYTLVRTGLIVEHICEGYYLEIVDKSSNVRRGWEIKNGYVDTGYRGEIIVNVRPVKPNVVIAPNTAIAQVIIRYANYPVGNVTVNGKYITYTEKEQRNYRTSMK